VLSTIERKGAMTNHLPDPDAVPDYAARTRVDGRRIVVAGAGAGIGRQTAHAARAAGARVACIDVAPELAEGVAQEVDGVPLVGNAGDPDDLARMLADAEAQLGGIDGIVDIIGVARFVTLVNATLADWDSAQRDNLAPAILLASLGGAIMAEAGGGSLVYIASWDGMTGSAYHAFYGMAKAAMLSLVRSAAVELGPVGVRVNAVSPGIVWTPRMAAVIGEEHDRWASLGPLGRTALPSDVASCALFLLSDLAAYVTGHNLVLDGGVSSVSQYPIADLYDKAQAAARGR
jgi:NAD(P)-dependent dehydrogenase (short-subunit alcohol dehydrogenase family)